MMNDLATLDQAIQVYRLDNGKVPTTLKELVDNDYVAKNAGFTDASGNGFVYKPGDTTGYDLSGVDTKSKQKYSYGSTTYKQPEKEGENG